MRKLGIMEHDECAPWCDHNSEDHHEDCDDSFCDGYKCWEKVLHNQLAEIGRNIPGSFNGRTEGFDPSD